MSYGIVLTMGNAGIIPSTVFANNIPQGLGFRVSGFLLVTSYFQGAHKLLSIY